MRRWFILLTGVCVVIAALLVGRESATDLAPSMALRQVSGEVIAYQDHPLQLKLIAKAENPQFANLQSVSSGQVVSVNVQEGQQVKKGAPMVCLDDTQAILDHQMSQKECRVLEHQSLSVAQEVARFNARLVHQESVLAQTESRFERISRLKQKGHVSDQEFEQEQSTWSTRQSEHEALMSQVEQARLRKEQMADKLVICESKQKRAKKNLDDRCLRAPFDGKVVDVLTSQGVMVSPAVPLVRFMGQEDDRLYAMILSSQLALIHRGVQKVELIDQSQGQVQYRGLVESQNGTFQLKFTSQGSFSHGKAYEVLLDLKPVKSSVLIDDAMLYDGRYVFSLSLVEKDIYQLVQEPVVCLGYYWQNEKRKHVCTFKNKNRPQRLLKTSMQGALDGMQVRVQ
ncbi:hypothetical protein N9C31_04800 [Gammaproteobacteria bacterium]|nr:hypothetical protein [Gammaproteobacteria bacterium]